MNETEKDHGLIADERSGSGSSQEVFEEVSLEEKADADREPGKESVKRDGYALSDGGSPSRNAGPKGDGGSNQDDDKPKRESVCQIVRDSRCL